MDKLRHTRSTIFCLALVVLWVITPKYPIYLDANLQTSIKSNEVEGNQVDEFEYEESVTVSEEEINIILDDWKLYRQSLYKPNINDDIETGTLVSSAELESKFLESVSKILGNREVHPDFYKVLVTLNQGETKNRTRREGLNVSYGITQINVKLIPLAQLMYPDFETNPRSQLLFLDDYIKVKIKKGYRFKDTINQYKYCLY